MQLLNRRHAAGVVTRFVKVELHCGGPLNEAADALSSAAAEADDSQLANELHLDLDSVHFYLDGYPTTWGIQVRNRLTKGAADSTERSASLLSLARQGREGMALSNRLH